jgi:hypothetical protein
MDNRAVPEAFNKWSYTQRAALIRRQAEGEEIAPHEIFLGFCRHTPAVVSNGPAGLNASIKGVGFLPKAEFVQETLDAYLAHIATGWNEDDYSQNGLKLLMKYLYGDGCADRIDFMRFGTLELARDHTWKNFKADPTVTLLFYQPPVVSYEVRGRVEIHEEGSVYHKLINAQHDVYHQPSPDRWAKRPVYVFLIDEIYDNSARETGFGKRIM